MANPTGEPHRWLAHLDAPPYLSPSPRAVRTKPNAAVPAEVTADDRVDGVGALALNELHPELHPVRERRSNNAVKDGADRQAVALDPEIREPGPPPLELVDLLEPIPEPVWCEIETVAMLVGHKGQGHRPRVWRRRVGWEAASREWALGRASTTSQATHADPTAQPHTADSGGYSATYRGETSSSTVPAGLARTCCWPSFAIRPGRQNNVGRSRTLWRPADPTATSTARGTRSGPNDGTQVEDPSLCQDRPSGAIAASGRLQLGSWASVWCMASRCSRARLVGSSTIRADRGIHLAS